MTRLRLVVDANVLFSAFLKKGVTRELLLDAPLDLYTPSWLRIEVERNILELAHRKNISRPTAHVLMGRIMHRVQEVPEPIIAQHAKDALERCKRSGDKDAPYVACAIAINGAIWTRDRRLAEEAGIKVYTTEHLRKLFLD